MKKLLIISILLSVAYGCNSDNKLYNIIYDTCWRVTNINGKVLVKDSISDIKGTGGNEKWCFEELHNFRFINRDGEKKKRPEYDDQEFSEFWYIIDDTTISIWNNDYKVINVTEGEIKLREQKNDSCFIDYTLIKEN